MSIPRPEPSVPGSCALCLDDIEPGQEMCPECDSWFTYWDRLSPEDRAAEIRLMDAHAASGDRT